MYLNTPHLRIPRRRRTYCERAGAARTASAPALRIPRARRPSASSPPPSTSRSPAPPLHISLRRCMSPSCRRRTSPYRRRRTYCERVARSSASSERQTSASQVKVGAAMACRRSAPSCSGAARPHPVACIPFSPARTLSPASPPLARNGGRLPLAARWG
jgi:hypothetical protein